MTDTPRTDAPTRPVIRRQAPFLVPPGAGFPETLAGELAGRLEDLHRDLVQGQDLAQAEAAAEELLAVFPSSPPAQVQRAAIDLLRDRHQEVVDRLLPVYQAYPNYLAAGLLLGKAHEGLGDIAEAFAAYDAIAAASPWALERGQTLRPAAVSQLAARVMEFLDRGRIDDAERELERLESWSSGETGVLEARRAFLERTGDQAGELLLLRELAQRLPDRLDLQARLADLEAEVGDLRRALEQLEALIAVQPENPELREKLQQVRFLWFVRRLPAEAQEAGRTPAISRSEYALLLYWLVPEVRSLPLDRPPVASDILDDTHRDKIVRVLNMGLMRIEEAVHRFYPERSLRRAEALYSLLRLLERSDLACVAEFRGRARPSTHLTCAAAQRCGLIEDPAQCLPGAELSGAESLGFIRLALERLGSA